MEILQIDPAMIVMGERLRAVDPDAVALLAESIRERGLDAPITVTAADAAGFHRLIAGAHRLSAVLALGLPLIPAIPFSGTELQAKLVEIEENLIRRELSEMDRATFPLTNQARLIDDHTNGLDVQHARTAAIQTWKSWISRTSRMRHERSPRCCHPRQLHGGAA